MAELVLQWINSLRLSQKVTCIEKDFSNGYLFGEILVKLKQLDSMSDFKCAHTPAAHLNNFTLLEPVLRRLDIRLDSNKIQLIIEEQEGAALQLLYQIKVAISNLSKNRGRALSDISRIFGTEKPAYEAEQKRYLNERLRKLVWPLNNGSARPRETSSRGWDHSMEKDENGTPATGQRAGGTRSPRPRGHRDSREKNHTSPTAGAPEPSRECSPGKNTSYETHQSSCCTAPCATPSGKAKRTLPTRAEKESKLCQHQVREDIAQFEFNLQRLGLDAASSTAPVLSNGRGLVSGDNQQNLEAELSKRLPSPSACHRENAKMMQRLHEARTAQELARKERERRRQKLLMEQNQARAASAASAVEEALIQKAQRRSTRATAVQHELWKVKQYQTVIEANRELRDAHCAEKRYLQEVRIAQRIAYAETVARESMHREVSHEAAQCRALKKQLRAAKRARLIEESLGIVNLILDLVAAASIHNQQHDTAVVDRRTWREWLVAFVEGRSALLTFAGGEPATAARLVSDCPDVFLQLSGPPLGDSAPLSHSRSLAERSSPVPLEPGSAGFENRLSEDDFYLYLNGEGQWHVRRNAEAAAGSESAALELLKGGTASDVFTEMLKWNDNSYPGTTERLRGEVVTNPNGEPTLHRLGELVSSLFELCYPESPLQRPTDVPNCPLRIVVTGKPYAGKKTLAKKLAEKFQLHVIHFEDLLKEALALQPDTVTHGPENGEAPAADPAQVSLTSMDQQSPSTRMLQLATETQRVLKDGEKLSSQLCVDLCVAKIQDVFAPGTLDNMKELLSHILQPKEQSDALPLHKGDKNSASGTRKNQKASAPAKEKVQATKESSDEASQQKLGWILVDFPQTYEQCVILEESLSGYVTPDRLPESDLSKKKARASFVLPIPVQPRAPQGLVEGGVDVHFVLDISTEEVLTRARSTGLSDKNRGSVIVDSKATDRSVHPAVPVGGLRPHSTVSVADECCYIEEEQKLSHLFLSLFGVEALTSLREQVQRMVIRKRQELTRESMAESGANPSAAQDAASEASGNAPTEISASKSPGSGAGDKGAVEIPLLSFGIASMEPVVKEYLMTKWEALEEEYVVTMMKVFAWVRQTRHEFARGIVDIQLHFTELLQRPDSKQDLVDTFIAEYNAFIKTIPNSIHLESIKEEMHLQVDELAESLWQQIDARRIEAVAEHKRLVDTGWLEAVCMVLAAQLETIVEAEVKRYIALEEFATDAYYNLVNACIPEKKRPSINRSALRDAAQCAVKQAFAWLCKQKSSNQDSASHKPWQSHIFELLEVKAKEHLVPLTEFEDYTPNTIEVDKKKASKSNEMRVGTELWFAGHLSAHTLFAFLNSRVCVAEEVTVKEETKPKVEPRLHVELQQTRLDLQVQLLCRVRRLCLWGAARLQAVAKVGNDVFGRMDDWIVARSLAEHAAVRELTTRIKYCIENERHIPHAMTLSGTQLILEPNALLGELEDEEDSRCVFPPPPTSVFTTGMLRSLMSEIKLVATGGLIAVEALREIIMRRVTQSRCFRTPTLPQTWLETHASKLAHIPSYFEVSPGSVDVIEFLLSLAFGHTGWPSAKQLYQISRAVRAVSSDAVAAKLAPRSGAAPLEFFISREEFGKIDFGDWLAACSKGEKQRDICTDGKSSGPAVVDEGIVSEVVDQEEQVAKQRLDRQAENALVDFLFDVFVSFQNPLRSCEDEASALRSLGYWTDTDGPHNDDGTSPPPDGRSGTVTPNCEASLDDRGTQEVYARKLLGYLALGSCAGDGLERLLAVSVERNPDDTGPALQQDDSLSVYDLYMTCMGVGIRPPFHVVPPTAKVPLNSFYKLLRADGKGPERQATAQGPSPTIKRVNVLEFLHSPSCTHLLMYSGPYFLRRVVTDFV